MNKKITAITSKLPIQLAVLLLLLTSSIIGAQEARGNQIPEFSIATIKDSTIFSSSNLPKTGLLMIKYFSPDCEHCQEEAQFLVSKHKKLKSIRTLWISGSWATLEDIKDFAERFKLHKLEPIAIGKEQGSALLDYYELTGVPFAAVFKDGQLIKSWKGELDFDKLKAIIDGSYDFSSKED